MSLQFLLDGLLAGLLVGAGAIGLTLTYAVLRFANFAHGELVTAGAYTALAASAAITAGVGGALPPLEPFSFSAALLAGGLVAAVAAALLALGLDALLLRRLRARGAVISVVMGSFGASVALRSLIEFTFSSRPAYFSRELQIATRLPLGLRITPDQLLLIGLAALLLAGTYGLVTRTQAGRAMRAVAENPTLARVAGIDVAAVVRLTWTIGGALAAAAGTMTGLLVQIRPDMGFALLLPMFSAAILGGIGSVPGAIVGGIVVGVAEAATVQFVGAQWRAGVAFVVLVAMLLARPQGLFGARA